MNQFDGKREVTGIICFFAAIALTLMYYLPSITGKAGEVVRGLGFGLIGGAAFMIPLFLFYASIDFFFERKKGVAQVRVGAVIMLIVLVASMFAACSMDFDYFQLLCTDSMSKAKATKAISLLWKSGIDSNLIKNPSNDGIHLTGGLIGGGIATALYTVAGRFITILALVVFLLSQIILIFQVSLKQTAKKTANIISQNVAHKRQQPAYPNVPSQNNRQVSQAPQVRQQQAAPQVVNRPAPAGVPATRPHQPSSRTQYINQAINPNNAPMANDPFSPKRMPVDRQSGFIDVTAKEFGANTTPNADVLNYGNRQVNIEGNQSSNDANYDFTSMPMNPTFRGYKEKPLDPSFLRKEAKQDFYDLGDGSEHIPYIKNYNPEEYVNNQVVNNQQVNDYPIESSYAADDLPEEIIDDYEDTNPYDYTPQETPIRQVRNPNIVVMPADSTQISQPVQPVAPVQSEAPASHRDDISINAEDGNNKGFSQTEGRIIEVSNAKGEEYIDYTEEPAVEERKSVRKRIPYKPAPITLLAKDENKQKSNNDAELKAKAIKLEETLSSFGINAKVINITHGPAITRFELTIPAGVKVNRVMSLQDDIQLAMAAMSIRIEAPIPGKSAIGIELPNDTTSAVYLRGLLGKEFMESSPLTVALGRDIPGKPIYCDLAKMPHLMIAGSTGSGKSVCINTILASILCKSTPDQVRLIMVDPKVVELTVYNGIPHLLMPVVTEPQKAANALKWAVIEMNRRYKLFAEKCVRDFKGYNEAAAFNGEEQLPLILIVVDELADLMTVAAKEVEAHIARLAAMARAAGLHMIIATQRPSVDVITGVIKSNIPSRIAFAVSSGVDSRTILDSVGAEKLLGKGDMLYAPLSAPKPVRGQGAFVSDNEVQEIVNYFKKYYGPNYDSQVMSEIDNIGNAPVAGVSGGSSEGGNSGESGDDALFESAVDVVIEQGRASVSILQRRLGIGYPRAGKLIDELESRGIIGGFEGSKPRKVLITKTDWLEMKAKGK